ncbi:hypothetical protein [Macrococcus lamae]|uniref:Uncharacterized protein n=1 Tax=Macrococcus lamae TaxID=198484 RepID=A0A4R6BU44_9STAP|nr:hypothetical protein [Macrococcus lamae]TDM10558.1 hypothetical protein ERX29_06850 [Macrococcus lamae]
MIFSRTPKTAWRPWLYLVLFVLLIGLIFEQFVQLLVAQLFPDIYSVLPFTLDIFFTEQLSLMTGIPSWVITLIIIGILTALIFWVIELLARYNEMQEELYIADTVDHALYKAIMTRPQVKYTQLPLFTGDFMRDNKGTRADMQSDASAAERYQFMHSALYSLPLDEVFYLKDIIVKRDGFRGLKFSAEAVTNRRNLLVKKRKNFFVSKHVNDYAALSDFIKSEAMKK